jgi:hypothetical protein
MARRGGSTTAARGTEGVCLREVDEACRRLAAANRTVPVRLRRHHFNNETDDIFIQ